MDVSKKRFQIWLLFYIVTLAVCVGGVLLLSLFIPIGTRFGLAAGLWMLLCFASLNFPEDIWDRWIF